MSEPSGVEPSETKSQFCKRCRKALPMDEYKKYKNGKYAKECIKCNIKRVAYLNTVKCPHGRQKNNCKECHGSQICEHGRQKQTCRECHGSSFCQHNKWKSLCKECHGSQICEHGRKRSRCKECHGGSICEHNRRRDACNECLALKQN